ncbi:(2Fe-2S)-binding protein [Pelomonas sp. V22]|uniref:2Fe-2S iron-sulfur cluster-binding protein n=1 Tax=Pelomonas sp. V22 TaxID=2822139 RepID=UPI0024A7B67F|nr:2Fe-2S iron-sulfur cluster-binding protein [Pelomonas sp. V22]MDI4633036.1 (2Fe-2S)-binding protein [Pelomonas sp. V22]
MKITINGQDHELEAGLSVAAALARAGVATFRHSLQGEPRAPLCGMGICQECRVRIDGRDQRLACMTPALDGMSVETGP